MPTKMSNFPSYLHHFLVCKFGIYHLCPIFTPPSKFVLIHLFSSCASRKVCFGGFVVRLSKCFLVAFLLLGGQVVFYCLVPACGFSSLLYQKTNVKYHKNCENTGKILKISCVRCNFVKFDFYFLGLS